MMRLFFFSVLAVAMIGVMVPSAFADIYVHESEYPFSIQHPPGWIVSPEDEWGGVDTVSYTHLTLPTNREV